MLYHVFVRNALVEIARRLNPTPFSLSEKPHTSHLVYQSVEQELAFWKSIQSQIPLNELVP